MIQSAADPARFAFPEESVTSVVSGKSYLADEVERSQLSSLPAHPSEMAMCSVTGIRVLPAELVVSDVSGVAFRNDQVRSSQLSGRRGHFGEFVASVIPAGWLAIDEAERSEMSGDWGAKAHAVRSEKPPHRQGLRHELGVCDLTGAKLLRDELGLSSVSHRRVDVAFLVPSEASGKLALADELVVCEQTGRRLLLEETETCAITGRRVDCRELVASVLSGKKGISHQMVRCPESAKVVLPAETVKCEVTGRRLAVSEIGRCVITGRAVGLASMSACPLSGERYVDDETSKAEPKRVMAVPDLLSSCEWTGRRQLTIKLVRCRLSNLLVDKSMVNERSELRVFRELLDGVDGLGGFPADARQLAWLRMASPEFGSAHSAEWVRSQAGNVLVGCVGTIRPRDAASCSRGRGQSRRAPPAAGTPVRLAREWGVEGGSGEPSELMLGHPRRAGWLQNRAGLPSATRASLSSPPKGSL
jgi:hypothetical protein